MASASASIRYSTPTSSAGIAQKQGICSDTKWVTHICNEIFKGADFGARNAVIKSVLSNSKIKIEDTHKEQIRDAFETYDPSLNYYDKMTTLIQNINSFVTQSQYSDLFDGLLKSYTSYHTAFLKSKKDCDVEEHTKARLKHGKFISKWVEMSEIVLADGMLKVHLIENTGATLPNLTSGISFFMWGMRHSTTNRSSHKFSQLQMQFNKPIELDVIKAHGDLKQMFPKTETITSVMTVFKSIFPDNKALSSHTIGDVSTKHGYESSASDPEN